MLQPSLRCCIPGCKSNNTKVTLYRFTNYKKVYNAWRTILKTKFPNICLTEDQNGRCNQHVCRLHFEDKYISKDGKRDRFAIPTLFTESEIATKTPEYPLTLECNIFFDFVTHIRHLVKAGQFTILDHPYACPYEEFNLKGVEFNQTPVEDSNNKDKLDTNDFHTIPVPDNRETEDDIPERGSREPSPWRAYYELCNDKEDYYWSTGEKVDFEPHQFSWQTGEVTSVEDHYSNLIPLNLDVTDGGVQPLNSRYGIKGGKMKKTHQEYYCDNCMKEIISFRYTCVECYNFDLCRSCEGKMLHSDHYMLRVPRPRPFNVLQSILDAIRETIKKLAKCDNSDNVEVKEEVEKVTEVEEATVPQPEAASPQAVSPACVWTTEALPADTLTHYSQDHTLDVTRGENDTNYSEIEEEPVIAISEAEEWLDETLVYSDDEVLGDKMQGLPAEQEMVCSSTIVVPESEDTYADRETLSEHFTLVDPLSIHNAETVSSETIPATNIPKTDTNRRNIASKVRQAVENQKTRLARLCLSEIEHVSFDSILPTLDSLYKDNIQNSLHNEKIQDSHIIEKIQDSHYKENIDIDQEIQQALDEIWHSNTISTETGIKRKPFNIVPLTSDEIKNKTLKQYSNTDSKKEQSSTAEHEPVIKPKVKIESMVIIKPADNVVSTTPRNLSDEVVIKPVPKQKSPDVSLLSIPKDKLSDNPKLLSVCNIVKTAMKQKSLVLQSHESISTKTASVEKQYYKVGAKIDQAHKETTKPAAKEESITIRNSPFEVDQGMKFSMVRIGVKRKPSNLQCYELKRPKTDYVEKQSSKGDSEIENVHKVSEAISRQNLPKESVTTLLRCIINDESFESILKENLPSENSEQELIKKQNT